MPVAPFFAAMPRIGQWLPLIQFFASGLAPAGGEQQLHDLLLAQRDRVRDRRRRLAARAT